MVYPMRLVEDERRIAHFFQQRDSSAGARTSFVSILSSPSSFIPEGPESPPATPVASSIPNGFLASGQALVIALSILALAILGTTFWRLRSWRRRSTLGAASISGKGDLERQKDTWLVPSKSVSLFPNTVAAPPGVAWVPQIRSISGPEPVKEVFKPLPPKRSRSPPPMLVSKPFQDSIVDSRSKSAPLKSPRISGVETATSLSSPSSPQSQSYALSVSGYQVRGIGTK